MKLTIKIPEEFFFNNIYSDIIEAAGKNPDTTSYNYRFLSVSPDFFAAYKRWMAEQGQEKDVDYVWSVLGPKVDERLSGGEVEILDGFFEDFWDG